MLSSTISNDERVRQLPCGNAMLLFSWMIAHADNLGRMRGEPFYLKAVVVPYVPGVTEQDVEHWLAKMADVGLIDLYVVKGDRYVQFRAWSKHQRLARMKSSDLPPPPEPPASAGQPLASGGVRTDSTSQSLASAGALKGGGRGSEVEVQGSRSEMEEEGERGRRSGAMTRQQRNPSSRETDTTTPTAGSHPAHCTCEFCMRAIGRRS